MTYHGSVSFPIGRISTSLALVTALGLAMLTATPASAASDKSLFSRWTTTTAFNAGTFTGAAAASGRVTLSTGTSRMTYDDPRVAGGAKTYNRGYWTSPWASTGFAAKSLVPSWSIGTPGGSWARIDVRVRSGSKIGSWDTVARYAANTTDIQRASYSSQSDDLARVSTDTVVANTGASFSGYQIRVLMMRPIYTKDNPTLFAAHGTAASFLTRSPSTSATTMTSTKELAVPSSSQMIHKGEFPQWGGGGEAWCSPTSPATWSRPASASTRRR